MRGGHIYNPKQSQFNPFEKSQQLDPIEQAEMMTDFVEDRKLKKFIKRVVPVLVIEVLILVALVGYLIFGLPKSFCEISAPKGSVVYVNDKKTKKFRMDEPDRESLFYYYPVDVSLYIPNEGQYEVSFTVSINKYKVFAQTNATLTDNVYYLTIDGGVRTTILTGITIKSEKLIKDYTVKLKINAIRI